MKEKGTPNWIEIVKRVTPLDTGEGSMVCTVALTCSLAEVVLASVVAAMQPWLWCDCHFLCNRVWWNLSAFNSSTYFVICLLSFRFVYPVSVNMWPGGRKKEKEHKTLRVSFWGARAKSLLWSVSNHGQQSISRSSRFLIMHTDLQMWKII